jgi:hypothetical protein
VDGSGLAQGLERRLEGGGGVVRQVQPSVQHRCKSSLGPRPVTPRVSLPLWGGEVCVFIATGRVVGRVERKEELLF